MRRREADEAAALLQRALNALLSIPPDMTTTASATLKHACGVLAASADLKVRGASLGSDLGACYDLARLAGGTFDAFERARAGLVEELPIGLPALAVQEACLRFVLAQEARVLSATAFTSREDVETALTRVNLAFQASIDFAADRSDGQTYQSLVSLHAAVVRDLQDRGRPLPRMASYEFGRSFPALSLANRLYGDAGRSDELVDENKSVHPLFMASSIRALTA